MNTYRNAGLTILTVIVITTATVKIGLALSSKALASPTPVVAPNPDRAFMNEAARGGMAEVQLGQMAKDKTANGDVKNLASEWSMTTARPATS